MKTLKFTPELCEQILSGEKTSTWRLFDDKNLSVGDEIEFVNKQTSEMIGLAVITSMKIRTLGTLIDEDWIGHERYGSEEEMYKAYREYYGDSVNSNSELKIIDFKFQST